MALNVEGIAEKRTDDVGATINAVYAKAIPRYAIYRTQNGIVIHFADDADENRQQRTTIAKINPVRGHVSSLIDGWRNASSKKKQADATIFDRRIADSLVLALEGDLGSAEALLKETQEEIIAERTSRARFQYLLVASIAAILTILFSWFSIDHFEVTSEVKWLWCAMSAGTVGAFFSIAIAIRGRTILTDLRPRDNGADAALRILIGAIAAVALIGLLLSKLVSVNLGTGDLLSTGTSDADSGTTISWLRVLVLGFMAGFFERLVPDLLDKTVAAASVGPVKTASGTGDKPVVPEAGGNGSQKPTAAATVAELPPDSAEDCCLADVEITEEQLTHDVELPAALGGVETHPS